MIGNSPLQILRKLCENKIDFVLYYADLLPDSTTMKPDETMAIRVLNLETLITLKEQLGHEKDLAALPLLRHALNQRKK